jgi:putative heme-binding domain-containing protein
MPHALRRRRKGRTRLNRGGRENLDYLLENIVDPNAVVPADYRMSVFELKDGRVLNGVCGRPAQRTLTIRTMTESLTIESEKSPASSQSSLSLMPEGLWMG